MEGVGLLLEDALRAAADHHALSLLVRFADEAGGERGHGLAVEDGALVHFGDALHTAAPQREPADAVHPRIDPLIEAAREFRIHPRGPRRRLDQVVVEQFPAQAISRAARDRAAAA